jgi:hypothetical protein
MTLVSLYYHSNHGITLILLDYKDQLTLVLLKYHFLLLFSERTIHANLNTSKFIFFYVMNITRVLVPSSFSVSKPYTHVIVVQHFTWPAFSGSIEFFIQPTSSTSQHLPKL